MKRIRKTLMLCGLALVLLLGGALTACGGDDTPPQPIPVDTTLSLSRSNAELDMFEEIQLSVSEAGEGTIAWSSSDNTVATVKDGLVKSVAAGTAVITAVRGEKSGSCKVTVVNSFQAPVILFGETEFVADKGERTHVTASVRYKGNDVNDTEDIEWNLTEIYNFENHLSDVATLTVDDDKRGATVVLGAYGEAQLIASAVVWGIPVNRMLQVRALSQNVEIASALSKEGENYVAVLNPIDMTYRGERVSKNSVDPQITVKENGEAVSDPQIVWLNSGKNVAEVDASGKIIAADDGVLGTDMLVGAYKGNCVKIDVVVERAEIEFADRDKWIMEIKDVPKSNGEFSVNLAGLNGSLQDGEVVGDIQKVEIPYKLIGADNVVTYTKRDILKRYDAETKTVTFTPPVHAYNMGDITATVTTSKAIYTMPMGIYTMIISDADELDEFSEYTTYQWDSDYIWDGYFVLDQDIAYNSAENLQSVNGSTRVFSPFIYAKKTKGGEKYFDTDCTVNVTSWNTGFFGVFDGRGHVIDGFMVDSSAEEKIKLFDGDVNGRDWQYSEWGGFIGKLGAATGGDTLRRGTIKNVAFTNVLHGAYWYESSQDKWDVKGTWGGFLYSMGLGGLAQNVYVEAANFQSSNGFLGGDWWLAQSMTMENIVLNIAKEGNETAEYAMGFVFNYSDNENIHMRNLYTIRGAKQSIDLGESGTISHTDRTPRAAFATSEALGNYLAEKGLSVSAENGWDMNFWTADANGAPVPLALTKIGLNINSKQLDMHEKIQLTANTTEEGTVKWASSDESVATVDQNGLVKSVAEGTAVITAEIDGYVARCVVTVVDTHTAPEMTVDIANVQIGQTGDSATVTADVTYKGNPVEEAVTFTWTQTSDNTNGKIAFTADGAVITVTGNAYGSATFKVETTVWGQTISSTVNVFVRNPDITFTSDLPKKDSGDAHVLDMDMFDQNGNVSAASAALTLKDGNNDVDLSQLTWRMSTEGIVSIEGGAITAICGGTTVLIASYQGASVTIEVIVNKEEKTLSDRWTIELKDKTDNFEVRVSDISSEIKGIVQKVEIANYNYYNGDTYERTDVKDILKSEENGTLVLMPPYRYREGMGETTVVVTTTQGVYTMPMGIYTLVISDEAELNEFGTYTTQQWARTDVSNYFWDGYFVLDSDINCTSEGGYTSFINAHLQDNQWLKYTVNGEEVDASKVGFRGMFDGRGHVINGMKIGNSEEIRGGLIGILNGVDGGRTEERGTIQNVAFTGVEHAQNNWSGFLYSVSTYGIVRNIYIQVNTFCANSFMAYGNWATQNTEMQNIVIDVSAITETWCNWYHLFGMLYSTSEIQNLYAVAPRYNTNGNSAINADSSVTLTDSTPAETFTDKQALGAYLAEKGLNVSAENGWDMNFWTSDENGAPVPIAKIAISERTAQLDMHEKLQLTANTTVEGTVKWTSCNEEVATVDQNGLVKSVAEGTAVIIAEIGSYKAYCTVTVSDSHTAPVIAVENRVQIAQKDGTATVTATVTYKGDQIEESVTFNWTKQNDNTGDKITFNTDGATVTITGGEYGSATFQVETTVWGQTISAIVNVFVANPAVTLSSSLAKKDGSDAYELVIDIDTATTASMELTLKDGDSDVDLSQLTWRMSTEGIVSIEGDTLTAVCGGTTVLTASYQGASIAIEVTVNKEVKTLDDRWTIELKAQTDNFEVRVSDISSEIKGIVQKVEIANYNYYNGDTYERTAAKNILKSEENGTLVLTPPYRYREGMGDTTVVVTTTQGIYTMPMSIYTLVISNGDELDEFGSYTTQQWENALIWDGYFVLDQDITYNENASEKDFASLTRHYASFISNSKFTDDNKFDGSGTGFVGMFDGRGHTIDGFVLAQSGGNFNGGFIGKLGFAGDGSRTEEKGTLQNVSFVNALHYVKMDSNWNVTAGTWGAMLCGANSGGMVSNVYVQLAKYGGEGVFGGGWNNQNAYMRNVVIVVEEYSYDPLFTWGSTIAGAYVHYSDGSAVSNVYVVTPGGHGDVALAYMDNGGKLSPADNRPESIFISRSTLGNHLAEKELTVSAENGWDIDFWVFDSYGAPVPKTLVQYNDTATSINLSTVLANTFGGVMPTVYGWNVSSASSVTFASSNSNVVTVSSDGLVVARGAGTATVTATAGTETYTLSVTVTDMYEKVKGFHDYIALATLEDIDRLMHADMNGKYVLACNIDLKGKEGCIANNFNGVFDGNGFALKNGKSVVQPNGGDETKIALFAGQTFGTIRNLKVIGWEIAANGEMTDSTEHNVAWRYPSVIQEIGSKDGLTALIENVYVEITVNAHSAEGGPTTEGLGCSAFIGQCGNCTVRNCLVNVTYNGNYYRTFTIVSADWGGMTYENVYASVSAADGVTLTDIHAIANNDAHDNLNYQSMEALKAEHGDTFPDWFWNDALQS